MRFRCVIFGLGGTLVDTLEDIALSMNRALAFHDFPGLPVEAYRSLAGRGVRRLALDCLPESAKNDATAEKVAGMALDFYAEKPLAHSRPWPGITELLYGLRDLRIKTAVFSGEPDMITKLVTGGLFPPACFDIVQGEIPGLPRKPDPAGIWEILIGLGVTPRETLFAGDSELDMETALAAECSPLGVSWGFRNRSALAAAGAARIIDSPEEMLALVRGTRY